jgi:hypothetical protein
MPEIPTTHPDNRLRLRLWIGGELRDEVWITADDPGALTKATLTGSVHIAAVERAEAAGSRWLVEVYDPDAPEGEAYLRFGTDTAGMVAPAPLNGFEVP